MLFLGLTSDFDPLVSALWVAGITGIKHHTWPLSAFYLGNFFFTLVVHILKRLPEEKVQGKWRLWDLVCLKLSVFPFYTWLIFLIGFYFYLGDPSEHFEDIFPTFARFSVALRKQMPFWPLIFVAWIVTSPCIPDCPCPPHTHAHTHIHTCRNTHVHTPHTSPPPACPVIWSFPIWVSFLIY
jgi:hypothetical protein